MVDLYIKFISAIISTYAIVTMTFAIFKIPIKENDKQIAIIALVLASTNFYLKFVIESNQFFLIQTVVYIVVMTLVRRYPILYSAVVCIISSIAIATVDAIVTLSAIKLNLTTLDKTINNETHFIFLHIAVTIIYFIIAFIFSTYRLGFSFVRRRFTGRYSLKSSTFVWLALLILGVTVLQFSSNNIMFYTVNSYMLIFAAAALLVSIFYAYFQNKKSILDRAGGGGKGV